MEAINETLTHIFVNVRVVSHFARPLGKFFRGGKLAIQKKVRNFEIGALFGELLNGVAAVAQDSIFPIKKGDGTFTGSSLHVGRIVDVQRWI